MRLLWTLNLARKKCVVDVANCLSHLILSPPRFTLSKVLTCELNNTINMSHQPQDNETHEPSKPVSEHSPSSSVSDVSTASTTDDGNYDIIKPMGAAASNSNGLETFIMNNTNNKNIQRQSNNLVIGLEKSGNEPLEINSESLSFASPIREINLVSSENDAASPRPEIDSPAIYRQPSGLRRRSSVRDFVDSAAGGHVHKVRSSRVLATVAQFRGGSASANDGLRPTSEGPGTLRPDSTSAKRRYSATLGLLDTVDAPDPRNEFDSSPATDRQLRSSLERRRSVSGNLHRSSSITAQSKDPHKPGSVRSRSDSRSDSPVQLPVMRVGSKKAVLGSGSSNNTSGGADASSGSRGNNVSGGSQQSSLSRHPSLRAHLISFKAFSADGTSGGTGALEGGVVAAPPAGLLLVHPPTPRRPTVVYHEYQRDQEDDGEKEQKSPSPSVREPSFHRALRIEELQHEPSAHEDHYEAHPPTGYRPHPLSGGRLDSREARLQRASSMFTAGARVVPPHRGAAHSYHGLPAENHEPDSTSPPHTSTLPFGGTVDNDDDWTTMVLTSSSSSSSSSDDEPEVVARPPAVQAQGESHHLPPIQYHRASSTHVAPLTAPPLQTERALLQQRRASAVQLPPLPQHHRQRANSVAAGMPFESGLPQEQPRRGSSANNADSLKLISSTSVLDRHIRTLELAAAAFDQAVAEEASEKGLPVTAYISSPHARGRWDTAFDALEAARDKVTMEIRNLGFTFSIQHSQRTQVYLTRALRRLIEEGDRLRVPFTADAFDLEVDRLRRRNMRDVNPVDGGVVQPNPTSRPPSSSMAVTKQILKSAQATEGDVLAAMGSRLLHRSHGFRTLKANEPLIVTIFERVVAGIDFPKLLSDLNILRWACQHGHGRLLGVVLKFSCVREMITAALMKEMLSTSVTAMAVMGQEFVSPLATLFKLQHPDLHRRYKEEQLSSSPPPNNAAAPLNQQPLGGFHKNSFTAIAALELFYTLVTAAPHIPVCFPPLEISDDDEEASGADWVRRLSTSSYLNSNLIDTGRADTAASFGADFGSLETSMSISQLQESSAKKRTRKEKAKGIGKGRWATSTQENYASLQLLWQYGIEVAMAVEVANATARNNFGRTSAHYFSLDDMAFISAMSAPIDVFCAATGLTSSEVLAEERLVREKRENQQSPLESHTSLPPAPQPQLMRALSCRRKSATTIISTSSPSSTTYDSPSRIALQKKIQSTVHALSLGRIAFNRPLVEIIGDDAPMVLACVQRCTKAVRSIQSCLVEKVVGESPIASLLRVDMFRREAPFTVEHATVQLPTAEDPFGDTTIHRPHSHNAVPSCSPPPPGALADGLTVFSRACVRGNIELVRQLLQVGSLLFESSVKAFETAQAKVTAADRETSNRRESQSSSNTTFTISTSVTPSTPALAAMGESGHHPSSLVVHQQQLMVPSVEAPRPPTHPCAHLHSSLGVDAFQLALIQGSHAVVRTFIMSCVPRESFVRDFLLREQSLTCSPCGVASFQALAKEVEQNTSEVTPPRRRSTLQGPPNKPSAAHVEALGPAKVRAAEMLKYTCDPTSAKRPTAIDVAVRMVAVTRLLGRQHPRSQEEEPPKDANSLTTTATSLTLPPLNYLLRTSLLNASFDESSFFQWFLVDLDEHETDESRGGESSSAHGNNSSKSSSSSHLKAGHMQRHHLRGRASQVANDLELEIAVVLHNIGNP